MSNVGLALVCLCAVLGATKATYAPVLRTRNLGRIQGIQELGEDGTPYYSFKGLRYAAPPVGPLRFKKPQKSWPISKKIFVNATELGPACLQMIPYPPTVKGSEDCLFLNVYTPSLPEAHKKLYPVVAFIHGGSFTYGNGTYSPGKLVSRGVIVVFIQYRLGVLGFLSSGDRQLPGNFGLHDQQLALKWVQQNIHEFRGDRNRVTLSGVSAGGASTTLQMVSPGSRRLFQRAIATSGVFLNPWVLHRGQPEKVRAVACSVRCSCLPDTPIADLVQCLRSADPKKLVEAQLQFEGWHVTPISPFGPVIDRDFVPEDPFKLPVA